MSDVEVAGFAFLTFLACFAVLMDVGLFCLVMGGLERMRHRNLFGSILVLLLYLAGLVLSAGWCVKSMPIGSFEEVLDLIGTIAVGWLVWSCVFAIALPKAEEAR